MTRKYYEGQPEGGQTRTYANATDAPPLSDSSQGTGSVFRVKNILDSDQSDRDKLGMLFSNRMDVWFQNRGAVSAKVWDQLFDDLIQWKQNAKNEVQDGI